MPRWLVRVVDRAADAVDAVLEPRDDADSPWTMPDEGEPHARTWMSFGASKKIWGSRLLPLVQRNLIAIASAIAQFEPVTLLCRPEDIPTAQGLLAPNPNGNITLLAVPVDDLWVRDYGCVFVRRGRETAGVDFNFNGWGEKQGCNRDAGVAKAMCDTARVNHLTTDICLEGGGIEVDGRGTAIVTESCVLNKNRNPKWTKQDIEEELGYLLGVRKVIWLPGIKGKDITDGHTDFYARFASPGVVVAALDNDPESFDYKVTRKHLDILRGATDANGQRLNVVTLAAPTQVRPQWRHDDEFSAGYVNFYVCNGGVVAPQFGDAAADEAARQTLQRLFPTRRVVQVEIDGLAAGGGGIHCATQQEIVH
ncbi:Putative agmatine deiminase [Vanrija pseudolonga]|uniref:Agmatine deiminase n=1 Tax=Vanrija pseudolonga TaxID=143232 RepID=A0AAF0YDD2_9TREE|nr:Putative agmatine deiminase [Vanrija pseudolonga]